VAVTWRHARAETTGLPTASADAVVVAQAWHWFERPRAAAEVRRILRPGGAIAIVSCDWLPNPGSVVEVSLTLAARHRTEPLPLDERLFHHGIAPYWPDDLIAAGFDQLELFGFDVHQRYDHAGWRGRMRASALVSTMPSAARAAYDDELARSLAMGFADPTDVPHRVFAVIARSP
jgi:SAM-dependent methyltransferase